MSARRLGGWVTCTWESRLGYLCWKGGVRGSELSGGVSPSFSVGGLVLCCVVWAGPGLGFGLGPSFVEEDDHPAGVS